jgi:hypothetical protein
MGTAPDAVKRLVDHLDQDRKVCLSPDYEEEQLRVPLPTGLCLPIRSSGFDIRISPHESLGWAVANKAALTTRLRSGPIHTPTRGEYRAGETLRPRTWRKAQPEQG